MMPQATHRRTPRNLRKIRTTTPSTRPDEESCSAAIRAKSVVV